MVIPIIYPSAVQFWMDSRNQSIIDKNINYYYTVNIMNYLQSQPGREDFLCQKITISYYVQR